MSPRSALAPRRLALTGLGLTTALLLAGCGAGQKAQTYQERSVADATNDAVGTIAVRNIAVEGPPTGITLSQGTDAPLTVTFVNEGGEDDVLVSASTPAATSVDVDGPSGELTVPRLQSGSSDFRLVLRDLTADLPTGSWIDMTLTFERNGSKTIPVPVQTTPEGSPRSGNDYQVAETDSAGNPIVEGDNVPEQTRDTTGDAGGSSTPAGE